MKPLSHPPAITINEEQHLLKHPFYQAWMEGKLSLSTLQDYACQYSHHVEAFPRYLENALSLCQQSSIRQILEENLSEENGSTYGTSHPELWLRFAEGLGVNRDEVLSSNPRPGIQKVVEFFTASSQQSLASALGALYAYECQVPEVAQSKIEGLKKNYQIEDPRTLSFFEVHKTADIAHRESLLQVMDSLSPEEKQEAQFAADKACQVLWNFLTDVQEQAACA